MVCVHQVNDGDYLTLLDRLEADLEELPSCVQDHFVVGCPPLGLCHATMMLAVSLTDQHNIESAVVTTRLIATPKKEWCTTTNSPSGTGWPGEVVLHGGGHSPVGEIFVPRASVLGRSGHGPSTIFRPPTINASSQVPPRFFHDLSPYGLLTLQCQSSLCANVCHALYCDG